MELTHDQKKFIGGVFESIDTRNVEFEESVELILEAMLDNDIVDLSEDENGDLYEDLHNTVWDFLEIYPNGF